MSRIASRGLLVGLLVGLALPAAASAHALLESASPNRGAQLERAPDRVTLRFDEPVEVAFGALRVYDEDGERVDDGPPEHPSGDGETVAVALRDGAGEGTYTVTYRVISADSHPVAGGFVFTVGRGGTPAQPLDRLIDADGAGTATEIGFGVVRGLSYLALALAIGGAVFLVSVWRPSLRAVAGVGDGWERSSRAFVDRARQVMLAAALLGLLVSALGIVFQGAVAAGTSFWQGLDATVIGDLLETRFGTVWGLRLLAWIAVAGLVATAGKRLVPPAAVALAALLAFLCVTPALAGHAATGDPAWLLIPANVLHVACMSVWVGGVGMLALALPGATRQLEGGDRTRLLATTVTRFSVLALAAVAGLVASGVVQSIAELDTPSALLDTAFGRAILIKVGLLSALITLGAWNRQRARPRLAAQAAAGALPGATGIVLRRSLRVELALMLAVLAVTAALVSYAPASAPSGPISASATLGPARLELTVDPARAGRNEIHAYLFDRRSGRQYGRVKELSASAVLPDRGIGPLPLRAERAGPGHYVIRAADIAPAGDWRLDVSARVSAFDAYAAEIDVPIR